MFDNIQPVSISARAAGEIRKIMETKNIPEGYGLRIGIKGGGCGGASLILGFDKKKDNDLEYVTQDIQVFVDKKHTLYVMGKEVDFLENAETRGFMFIDPAADNSNEP
jgi:iron-sulfur cluster assembly protein